MRVDTHRSFGKGVEKLDPKIKRKLAERLRLFASEPFHPLLDNHALTGEYEGVRSINITGDFRAIYLPTGLDVTLFMYIGTHSQLYGK